jgi:hydrogenase maturation protease
MLSKEVKKVFLVGVGNLLRNDDGVGPLIAEKIAKMNISGVSVITSQLLNIELLEDAIGYERILIVDASAIGTGVMLKKIKCPAGSAQASSHHLSPEFLLAMAQELYETDLNLYVCCVRGQNFDVGNTLSASVVDLIPQAVAKIEEFLTQGQFVKIS